MSTNPNPNSPDWQWFVVGRWQEYAGEARANLVRVAAIGLFYVIQLVNFHLLGERSDAAVEFHQTATLVAAAWSLLTLGVLLCLRQRIFPAYLKFLSTGGDIALLTCLALAVKEGPAAGANSPLVGIYFLVIALSGLRFRLPLVWFTALGSMAAYVVLVAVTDRRQAGEWFDADHAVPVVEQLITLAALGLSGVVVGQIIRRVRSLAEEYRQRLDQAGDSESANQSAVPNDEATA